MATPDETIILEELQTTGAGPTTARGGSTTGAEYSDLAVTLQLPRLAARRATIEQAASAFGVPPALLAAISSRESSIGACLDAQGRGDNGHAYGECQLDYRSHVPLSLDGPGGLAHYLQAASVLAAMRCLVAGAHQDWSLGWQWRGACAAYNAGPLTVRTQAAMDLGTTGNDYSSDVWARARKIDELWR